MPSNQPVNRAAWLPFKKAPNLEFKTAPYTAAPDNGLVINNHAVAINPIDWLIQQKGDIMFGWLKYPAILGSDVAGEVVEVGKNVKCFQVGDRVLGFCLGKDEKVNSSAESAFQNYTVLQSDLTSHIPSSMPYENAAVIPLGLSTAAAGLFQDDQLSLQYPSVPPKPTGKTLLVWGGSTSVGCNAIQLGVAAGYEVFATSSPMNFDYLRALGASKVFDYNSKSVIQDIIAAFKGKKAAGALAIGTGGAEACMRILDKTGGHKFVTMATYPVPQKAPQSLILLRTVWFFVSWIIIYKLNGMIKGIKSNFIFGSSIAHNPVGKAIYVDFLPKALETGAFVPAPEPLIAGQGIESIETAFGIQQKGVSAKKVVVTL